MTTYPNPKINLGLNVLRRRTDGFHDLETLFVPYYGISDVLEIDRAEETSLVIRPQVDWSPEDDLVMKAYRLLKDEFSLPPVRMVLTKNVPVGAGLGGGSSDAAFALKMLNEMFSLGLNDAELAKRAAKLGSDCAFFIYDRPMLGTGRGEILEPFDVDLSGYETKVEIPFGVSVSTAEAYRGVLDARIEDVGPASEGDLSEALKRPLCEWKDCVTNDFERTVFQSHPEIELVKRRLYAEGAVYAAMSGSGSSVFGLFKK